MLQNYAREFRYSIRTLLADKVFSITAIGCLAVGIGASTAIFGLIDAVILRPLPFADADRLVVLRTFNPQQISTSVTWNSASDFRYWQQHAKSYSSIAGFTWSRFDEGDDGNYQRLVGLSVTPEYFETLQLVPSSGRFFRVDEQADASSHVVMGHHLWQQRWAGDPGLVGRSIRLNRWGSLEESPNRTVCGVLPPGLRFLPMIFRLKREAVGVDDRIDHIVPLDIDNRRFRMNRFMGVIARLKDGVTLESAQAEMDMLTGQLRHDDPFFHEGLQTNVIPLTDQVVGSARRPLWLLMSAVACVLAIVCFNVAQLMVLRATKRQREIAIRRTLGATWWQLARQLIMESSLVSLVGGGLGLILAAISIGYLPRLLPAAMPRVETAQIDLRVAAFALLTSIVAGIIVGLIPAGRALTPQLGQLLNSEGRSATQGSRRLDLSQTLIVTQIAMTLALLVAAGLLSKSYARLLDVNQGFSVDHRVVMDLSLPAQKYAWDYNSAYCRSLVERIDQLPGVVSSAAIVGLPLSGFDIPGGGLAIEGKPVETRDKRPAVLIRVVTDGYFRTMDIPLLAGRQFTEPDSIGEIGVTRVAICNQALADSIWPGEQALGKRFLVNPEYNDSWAEIIGIVGNVTDAALDQATRPELYYPEKLFPQGEFTFVTHVRGDPQAAIDRIRQVARDVEPDVFISDVKTMDKVVSESIASQRAVMILLVLFCAVAIALTLTGIFGVSAYAASQRTREIGIRMALGAQRIQIVCMLVLQAFKFVAFGVAFGTLLALVVASRIEGALFRVRPVGRNHFRFCIDHRCGSWPARLSAGSRPRRPAFANGRSTQRCLTGTAATVPKHLFV